MTEPAPSPEAEAAPPPTEEGGGGGDTLSDRMDRLEALVERFIEGSGQREQAEPPDIKAEVRAAVRQVQEADRKAKDREAAETEHQQSIEERIKGLEHKLEDKPFEYKRSTNMMGWAKP